MTNTPPLASIRCLTYNHEQYIRQCLDGFIMQKTNFPFEIIVHDDASTDKTADIIREYAKKHPNIHAILETENQYSKHDGSLARIVNQAIRGKYVALCEGDDYWTDPLKLQKQVDFLEKNPEYGMVYTLSKIYNQNKMKIEEYLFGSEYKGYGDLLTYNRIPTLTTCIKTKVMMEYIDDIEPHKRNWLMGDYPMWLWIGYHHKIKFFPDVTCVYRVLEESASHSKDIGKNEKFILSTIDITSFYIKRFKLFPPKSYYHALNEYYRQLYSEYKRLGKYTKAMHYAKLINNKYATPEIRQEKRKFYLKHIKLWLQGYYQIKIPKNIDNLIQKTRSSEKK